MTISAFHEAAQAEDSRALARRWTDEALSDFELTTTEEGARADGCWPMRMRRGRRSAHPDAPTGVAAVRRYRLARGSVAELIERAKEFARQLETLPGFHSYQVMDLWRRRHHLHQPLPGAHVR